MRTSEMNSEGNLAAGEGRPFALHQTSGQKADFRGGHGAQGRNRTTDTRIFSPLLYRLSYLGTRGRRRFLKRDPGKCEPFSGKFAPRSQPRKMSEREKPGRPGGRVGGRPRGGPDGARIASLLLVQRILYWPARGLRPRRGARYGIAALQPAAQIHIGTTPRAEGTEFRSRRLAADRAFGPIGRPGITGLRHRNPPAPRRYSERIRPRADPARRAPLPGVWPAIR